MSSQVNKMFVVFQRFLVIQKKDQRDLSSKHAICDRYKNAHRRHSIKSSAIFSNLN